jgi:putative ABC transport system permease protein
MYFFLENLRISITELWGNKTRSFLTAIGIVIGIVAVTLMSTLITGVDNLFDKSMSFLGRDVVYVEKYPWIMGDDYWLMRNRPQIDLEMASKIKAQSNYALVVAKERGRNGDVTYGKQSAESIFVHGVSTNYPLVSPIEIADGRFFTESENRARSQVLVLGYEVAENLFPNENPIGKEVFLRSHRFRVIGILKKMGKLMGAFSLDTQVILPVDSYEKIFRTQWGMRRISIKVPESEMDNAIEELTGVIRVLRGLKPSEKTNFAINQQKAFEQQYSMIKMAIGGTGLVITIMSLIVGGIGIANIMFVTVKERTREIGVRKALGARRNIILGQFLMESVMITGAGGVGGLLIASILSYVINAFVFPAQMSFAVGFMAIALSTFVGVVAGWTPARKAADLDPIEALRYE